MLKPRDLLKAWGEKRITGREFVYAATVMSELQIMGEAVRLGKPLIERAVDPSRMVGALAILGLHEEIDALYEADVGAFDGQRAVQAYLNGRAA